MAIDVLGAIRPALVEELHPGDPFLMLVPGGGHCVGMLGHSPDNQRLLVFFGSDGTNWDAQGVGAVALRGFEREAVFVLTNAFFELDPGKFGFPVPAPTPDNGSIVVDESGEKYVYTRNARPTYFSLATGESKPAPSDCTYYNSWKFCWRPSHWKQDSDPIVVFSQGDKT